MRRRTPLGRITLPLLTLMTAMLGGFAFSGSALATQVWGGEVVITGANGTCTTPQAERRNIGTGTVLKSIFRPKLVSGNGANTRISFSHDSGALFVIILQDTGPNGRYARQGINHSGMAVLTGLRDFNSFQITPANPSTTTDFIRISGRIEDFMFLTGCTVTFRAAYSRD